MTTSESEYRQNPVVAVANDINNNPASPVLAAINAKGGGGGGGGASPATATALGTVQLAGDLGGAATAPTVPGLTGKAATVHTHADTDITNATTTGRALVETASAAAARTTLSAVLGTNITEVQVITQAAYTALGAGASATTLYVISG